MGKLNQIAAPTVYLDTNIFIYAVEDLAGLGTKLRTLFARFDSGELHAVTSELSLAELLVKPIREGDSSARQTYERMLQSTPSLTVVPVNRGILVEAARLRATTSLKLPDAIHVATAFNSACTTFLTNDMSLDTLTALPVLQVSSLP
jgi:predicted nucleic acid-binding protein